MIYNNNKERTMTNDTLSKQMVEALALADAERAEAALTAPTTAPFETEEETTFVQEESEDEATLQV